MRKYIKRAIHKQFMLFSVIYPTITTLYVTRIQNLKKLNKLQYIENLKNTNWNTLNHSFKKYMKCFIQRGSKEVPLKLFPEQHNSSFK